MSGDVIADINYLSSTTDGCSPWLVQLSIPATKRSNIEPISVRMTIHDLRGKEKSVNLDTNALEVLNYESSIQEEFVDGSEVQQAYFQEIGNFLQKQLSATRVIVYHHVFRSRNSPFTDEQTNESHRNPVFYPHVDIDASAVPSLVEKILGKEETDRVLQYRMQIINIWCPLGANAIIDKPLTICDYRSLNIEEDIRPLAIRGSNLHPTAYTLCNNAENAHVWYYLSQMQSNEMFVMKMYDNKPGVAQFAFHTAFMNGYASAPNLEQKSLELRCLVLYDQ